MLLLVLQELLQPFPVLGRHLHGAEEEEGKRTLAAARGTPPPPPDSRQVLSERGGDPVDGRLQRRPQSEAQCFVRGVSDAAQRPHGFTGGMRQLEVSVHRLPTRNRGETCHLDQGDGVNNHSPPVGPAGS